MTIDTHSSPTDYTHTTPLWYRDREALFDGKELAKFDVPILPISEKERRWSAVRDEMAARGIDCLILTGTSVVWGAGMANVRYLTEYGSGNGADVVFPLDGEPTVFAGSRHMSVPFHVMRHAGAWVDDIRPRTGLADVIRRVNESSPGSRIGLVGYIRGYVPPADGVVRTRELEESNVSIGYITELRRLLPDADWVDATAIVENLRVHKSDAEIEFLRTTGRIARARVQRLIDTARPGVTEAEVWTAMYHEQIVQGGEAQAFNMLISGPTGDDHRVQHLLHGVEPPQGPTWRTLDTGDIVICEFHTQYGGYLAATEFSVMLGKAPDPLLRAHDACMEYLDRCDEIFGPGKTFRSAVRAIHSIFESRGLDWVELGFHGHGLSSPEYPLSVYREGDMDRYNPGFLDRHFEENMVIGLNMDVHDPNWRKDVGLMFGDMALITAEGTELLVDIPRDVFELDL